MVDFACDYCGDDQSQARPAVCRTTGGGASQRMAMLLVALVAALAGCGGTTPAISRPAHAVFDRFASCGPSPPKPPCGREYDLRNLLGLSVGSAEARAKEHSLRVRVTYRDGHGLMAERNWNSGRVNVAVIDGIVTAIRESG